MSISLFISFVYRGLRFPQLGQHQLLQLRQVLVKAAEGDAEPVGGLAVRFGRVSDMGFP